MLSGVHFPAQPFDTTRGGQFFYDGGALQDHTMHTTRVAFGSYYQQDGHRVCR